MISQIACESSSLSMVNLDVYLGEMASQIRKKIAGWDLSKIKLYNTHLLTACVCADNQMKYFTNTLNVIPVCKVRGRSIDWVCLLIGID